MARIFHITHKTEWQAAQASGEYAADSLSTQGFIHCSTSEQVLQVVNLWFKGQRDLLLLEIDVDRVCAEIKYENLDHGTELFPHVYGPIKALAVLNVHELIPGSDGSFKLPKSLSNNA